MILALAGSGTLSCIEIDTNHFRGNYPDDVAIEGASAPGANLLDLLSGAVPWCEVLQRSPLGPHQRHFFSKELTPSGPLTHLRVSVYPDGGISRLRAWGTRTS